jgi:uncharacterized protein (DUF1501 family)
MTDGLINCCGDFSRAHLLRRAVAEAGQGLPAIEPGMPLPAGTGMTRRTFVSGVAGLAVAVYGAGALGPRIFDEGIANAATSGADSRVLVSIFMDGGADALSILFPAGEAQYRTLRPTLGLDANSGTAFAGDTRLRWHPAAASLATLHAESKLTVFPAIGYTSPDFSHFTSRHYWEVGATEVGLRTGWLGRYLDRTGAGDNPLQGLSLGLGLSPLLATTRVPVAATLGPRNYQFRPRGTPRGQFRSSMVDELGNLGRAHASSRDPALRQAGRVALQSNQLRHQLEALSVDDPGTAGYPPGWNALPLLAQMLGAGLPIRCVALSAPGAYDTHANQPNALADGLKLTADSLLAFQRDLERRGLADRVLVHVWSEFGRRAKENGSLGTDHGAAGIGFLMGTRASGTTIGEFPGLANGLDQYGNVKATSDFRGIYSALLEQWLGTDADGIIPKAKSFARPILVR